MSLAVLISDGAFLGAQPMSNVASLQADARGETARGRRVILRKVDDAARQEQIIGLAIEHGELNFSTARGVERRLAEISGEILALIGGAL